MPWPSPQDYAEAIQSPLSSLSDPELQRGQVQLNALGLPRCLSGAFATVFCMECSGKKVAVRCFLSNIKEQEERYAEISKFVLTDDLPYTVGFEYQKEGIQVRGEWYPILKMEWVEGETLGNYLEKVKESDIFGMLAGYFKQMTLELRRAGISHGDLQHDNIMIHELELRLVDYDGMFVPSLAGRAASELGHRNYQHPARESSFFNSSLDNFSAWIIWVSLKCLAHDPSLWKRMDAGGDCLLFRRTDFTEPESSRAFEILESHENEMIRRYAAVVRQLISLPIDEVPTLDNPLHQKVILPARDTSGSETKPQQLKNEPTPRFATDSDYDDSRVHTLVSTKKSEQLPQLVVTDFDAVQNQVQKSNLPMTYVPDSLYPSVSSLDLGECAVGSYIDVEQVLTKQLLPNESVEWNSFRDLVRVYGAPPKYRNTVIVLLMLLVVIPCALIFAFDRSPGHFIAASVAAGIAMVFLYRPAGKVVTLLTNHRLIVAKIGDTIQLYSIPLTEIERVKVHKYQAYGGTTTVNSAEIHAKHAFRTPGGRLSYFTIDCQDHASFLRKLPKDIQVTEVIHTSS